MKMTNISVISFLLLSLIVVGLTNAQSTNSTNVPLVGSQNSLMCTVYNELHVQTYEMPIILTVVLVGALIIGYEAFKRMALQREEKEGVAEADVERVMSKIYTTMILTGIVIGVVIIALTAGRLIVC